MLISIVRRIVIYSESIWHLPQFLYRLLGRVFSGIHSLSEVSVVLRDFSKIENKNVRNIASQINFSFIYDRVFLQRIFFETSHLLLYIFRRFWCCCENKETGKGYFDYQCHHWCTNARLMPAQSGGDARCYCNF